MSNDTHNHNSDTPGVTRRNFLGWASAGAVALTAFSVIAGIFRMSKPTVHYEEATKFKIGKPESFPVGTVKKLEEKGVFIFSRARGDSRSLQRCR